MTILLASVLAAFLDPIRAAIILVGILFFRNKWVIFTVAALSAIIIETMLSALQVTRVWGQGLVPGAIASLLQAIVLFWIVSYSRGRTSADQSDA